MIKKNLLITHVDVDGVSPIILLNLTNEPFEYKSIEINEVDKCFKELESIGLDIYNKIYVCDLTLTEYAYSILDQRNDVFVFDHHKTHLFADNKNYTTIKVELNNRQTCATELFYEFLKKDYPILNNKNVKEYVEIVRQLDTYDMKDDIPKQLDLLKSCYGRIDFVKTITRRLKKEQEHFSFNSFEKRLIKLRENEKTSYLFQKDLKMKTYLIGNYKVGVSFAEKYKSELGQYLANKYPNLDFVMLIDADRAISYRTTKEDIDVSEIASLYSGGGHQKASGSPIDEETVNDITLRILKNDTLEIKEIKKDTILYEVVR